MNSSNRMAIQAEDASARPMSTQRVTLRPLRASPSANSGGNTR